MFFGDPYKFAIHCDIVKEWNDDYFWINGIFNIYIDGKPVLNEIYNSELKFTLSNITEEILNDISEVENVSNIGNVFSENKSILGLSSPEMEDLFIFVYFCFSEDKDYILLKNNDDVCKFEYSKNYIKDILYSILNWKIKKFKV